MVCKSTSWFWGCRSFNCKKHLGTSGKPLHELQGPAPHCVTSIETQTQDAEIRKKKSREVVWEHHVGRQTTPCASTSQGFSLKTESRPDYIPKQQATSKDCILLDEDHLCNTLFSLPFWENKLYLNYSYIINNGNSISIVNCGHKWHLGSWLPQNPVWGRGLVPTSASRFGNKYSSVQGDDGPASLNMGISWKDFFFPAY